MNNMLFVSIIIAVYNGEKVIDECIRSLLTQNYPRDKYEIIIADNNSTDRTREIIKKYPVKYVLEDAIKGPSAARNAGAKVAKGEIFLFFDSDQVAEKDWIKEILEGWDNLQYCAFAGKNIYVNSKDSLISEYWSGKGSKKIQVSKRDVYYQLKYFAGGNIAIRKSVFKELDGFSISIPTCEDIDLALRLYKKFGLSIKFNENAIAYHKERDSLKDLLKREFWFGYGSYIVERMHSEIRQSSLILTFKAIARMIVGCIALAYGIFKPMKERNRIRHLQLILLDISMRWANCFGRFCSLLNSRKRKICIS